MPELADLLVLLHESAQRWQTLDAVLVTEIDYSGLQEAVRLRMGASVRRGPVEPAQVERRVSARYRVRASRAPWQTRWDRLDHQGNDPNGIPPELVLDDGETAWEQTGTKVSRNRLRVPRSRPVRTGYAMLLPHDLGADHRLTVTGTGIQDDRPTWLFSASPRDPLLPTGSLFAELRALTGELEIDAATGILLSARWSHQDRVLSSAFLEQLRVDPAVDPEVFRYSPPPNAQIVEGLRIPNRFVPAATVGLLTAVVSDRIARMFGRGPR